MTAMQHTSLLTRLPDRLARPPAGTLWRRTYACATAVSRRTLQAVVTLAVVVAAPVTARGQPAVAPDDSRAGITWVTPEIRAPGVSFHTFDSSAAKAIVSYHLYTPTAYERAPERRFPVVYWLHGSGGGLPGIPKVAARFATAIEAGKVPPCLVVFVNGMPNGMYVDWKDGSAPIETVIVEELLPHVDATHRTIATREGRLLDGYSMGGYGAARLGFKYPRLFRSVSIMGGGPLQAELLGDAPRAGRRRATEVLERVYGGDQEYFASVSPRVLAERHADEIARASLIRMVCGDRDETFANNREFHEHLARLKIPHAWTVLPGVDHDPLRTLDALGDSNWSFYRKAFGAVPGVRPDDPDTQARPTIVAGRFVPDFRIKPDDYTVLMVADGRNPGGLRAWIDDHRRMQVKNWPLGGQTTWDVDVVEAGDYAVNVLFNHGARASLAITVTAGEARCEGVSDHVAHHEWRRFPLPGSLRLARGRQTLSLGIASVGGESAETLELLSIELVRPEVRERLRKAASAMRSQADTRWFRDARYGLMCHWTSQTAPRHGPPRPYAEAVRNFDVGTFADQVERTGAKFVTLTTSHAMLYFPAPLGSLDRILPGRTAQRDLVGELAEALGRRGIRLMLYYHLGSDADPAWQMASGFWNTDTSEFWDNWTRVIGEAGDRYGDRLAGWWFDDGTANYYYRSAPWERLATAAKAGNPRRLVCFNPWVLPPATEFQDYLAGEGTTDPSLQGWLKPGDHGRISGGAHAGLQASAAVIMEGDWLHSRRDTEIGAPRQSAAQLAELLRRFAALENVPMLNCEIYQDGTLSPATVEALHAAHQALATDAEPRGR